MSPQLAEFLKDGPGRDRGMHTESEFKEIGHSGGQVIFHVTTSPDGGRSYQVTYRGDRPVPTVIFAIYALLQGIPVGSIQLGGIGQPWNDPPFPDCVPVFYGSDSHGKFGHHCPQCRGYWRSNGSPSVCPYCAAWGERHDFLSDAQRVYAQQYCKVLSDALRSGEDGEHVIDMDAVADAAGKNIEKPPFYYAEESQQNKFTCGACGEFNDILGRFGYCSACGTRNDLREFEDKTVVDIRRRINAGGPYEACVRDAVSAFDSLVGSYARQFAQRIPMRSGRKARIEKMRFHNLETTASEIKAAFDIDLCEGMKADEVSFAKRMFYRRHVYEHRGGEADEKYIAESGDKTVRPKQTLHETQESAHQLADIVVKMARNLHDGFHEIFPPEAESIRRFEERKKRARR
ncbi:MAG TPA: hypothetical protein VNE63_11190 [Candidatus Acidoferrales bacterium]|nr:hypothetical protein [Candidatus Acidoferrales bacterium]